MSKKITTVCGEINADELGFTSLHEHTLYDLRIAGKYMRNMFQGVPEQLLEFKPENYPFLKSGVYLLNEECAQMNDLDYLIKEFSFFTACGGKSIVDCSPIGVRGDIDRIKELSEKTGINIVCATGVYTKTSRPPQLIVKDEEFYYETFKKEVEEGIDGTTVRPGILKAAIATYEQDGKLSEEEILPIRACGRLSGETGLSVHIHTDPMIRTEDVVFAAQAAIDAGAEPDKVHICHMDNRLVAHIPVEEYLKNPTTGRNISLDTQKELLSMGVTIGLDTWGMPIQNSSFFATDDFERLKALINLVDLGYEDKITIGHDFSSRIMGRTYGGYGCSRFMEFAIPVLKQLGYENVIPKITIDNPARILSR
ncbi:hypothetical protein [Butyrivibrio sp. AC2005]|uniref:phosphotriesterase family protein n=1 Tax=Butyrivibrio sp. AC2005 TaxID=1280672 RepID=UPI000414757B|nr:hypothetical protein [Butyrivibrio sp. AC2005]